MTEENPKLNISHSLDEQIRDPVTGLGSFEKFLYSVTRAFPIHVRYAGTRTSGYKTAGGERDDTATMTERAVIVSDNRSSLERQAVPFEDYLWNELSPQITEIARKHSLHLADIEYAQLESLKGYRHKGTILAQYWPHKKEHILFLRQ